MMSNQQISGSLRPILELTNITKRYGGVHALDGVDISLSPGEVVALVGDNGAGKSTLVKVMAGAVIPDSGEYIFDGSPVTIKNPTDPNDLGIRTVYQDLALCDNLDAVSNLFLGREITGPRLLGSRIRRAEAERQAKDVLRRLRLDSISLARPVRAMSGGQRQNIAVARALLGDGKVVLLDEPTAALSHSATDQIRSLVRTLAEEGLAVLVISHDIHKFVLEVADRIEVLRLGRIVASYQSHEVTGEQVVNAMVGGDASTNSAR